MTTGTTDSQLRAYVERMERMNAEKQDALDGIKELKAEVKGAGFDVKTLLEVVRRRAANADDVAEADANLAMYLSSMGM